MNTARVKNFLTRRFGKDSLVWGLTRAMSAAVFQIEYRRNYQKGNPFSSFRELYVEPVSYCNLRCRWCALDHLKPKVRMDISTFEKALEQVMYDKRLRHLRWLHLHNGGESTLHPNIVEMLVQIETAKNYMAAKGKGFPKVSLLTNGTVFRKDLKDALKTTKAIDILRISMDGGTPEQYEYIRNRAKWDDFSRTSRDLIQTVRENPNKIHVEFISLIADDQRPSDLKKNPDFASMLKLADDYEVRYSHGWGGQLEPESAKLPNQLPWQKRGCRLLLNSLVLLADGHVTVCCADLNGKGVIGKFPKEGLAELYVKVKRLWMLERVARGWNAQVPLCAGCEGF